MLVQEYSHDHWVNIHDMLHVMPLSWHPYTDTDIVLDSSSDTKGFFFIWGSERSGYLHPYLLYCMGDDFNDLQSATTCGYTVGAGARQYYAGIYTAPALNQHAASRFQLPPMPHPPVTGGGEWVVDSILAVDDHLGGISWDIYFTASMDGPTSKHLYRTQLTSTTHTIERITPNPPGPVQAGWIASGGWHDVVAVDVKTNTYVDVCSSAGCPPVTTLRKLDTAGLADSGILAVLLDPMIGNQRYRDIKSSMTTPVFDKFIGPDVVTVFQESSIQLNSVEHRQLPYASRELYCSAYIPDITVHGPGPYPIVVAVYGGPHVQMVLDKWMPDMRSQKLCQDGYLVVKCDNRGSSRRGISFEGALYRNMGCIEVADQCAVVNHFTARGLADPSLGVGVFGWSYGGYLSAMCLVRAPHVFTCAVAGAPVTSWDGYDTHYTERYMDTPQQNPEGYERSSVMSYVRESESKRNRVSKLMLVHGLIDENVHFRHTARLINKLLECRNRLDDLIYGKLCNFIYSIYNI